jgi:uncharacterized protein
MRPRRAQLSAGFVLVQAALICEGLLLVSAYVLASLADIRLQSNLSVQSVLLGLAVGIPLIAVNLGFSHFILCEERFPTFYKFKVEVLKPLCRELPWPAAIAVSLLSGLGEEIFFRGFLQSWLASVLGPIGAILITNALFAVVHFIGRVREYRALLPYYFACGLYFSLVVLYLQDLTPPIIAHILNNFVAVMYVRCVLLKE